MPPEAGRPDRQGQRRPRLAWRLALVLLLATLVGLGTGFLVATMRPVTYEAEATLDLRTLLGTDNPVFENVDKAEREATNQALAAESSDVVGATLAALNLPPSEASHLSADSVSGTDALRLKATATDPAAAARKADAYAQAYVERTVTRRTSALQAQQAELATAIRTVEARAVNPRTGFTAATKQAQLQSLTGRLGEVVTQLSSVGATDAQPYLLEAPRAPTSAAGPAPWMWGAAAGVASFLTTAGVLGALVYQRVRARRRA